MNGKLKISGFAVMVCLTFFLRSANSESLITFDDVTANAAGQYIPNGYAGLNWSNFGVENTTDYLQTYGENGYTNGTVSGPNAAFNAAPANPATVSSATGTFTLNSGYFTGAWRNGLNIEVKGYLDSIQTESTSFVVDSTSPTLETFNWQNVDHVTFASSGGTSAGYQYSSTGEFALDNLLINAPVSAPAPLPNAFLAGSTILSLLATSKLARWLKNLRAA